MIKKTCFCEQTFRSDVNHSERACAIRSSGRGPELRAKLIAEGLTIPHPDLKEKIEAGITVFYIEAKTK